MHLFDTMKTPALLLGLLAALGLATPAPAQEPRVALAHQGAMLPALRTARPLGRLAGGEPMHLALILPLRNQMGLDTLLHNLYDPHSPQRGQFLTPAQFTEKFGPTPQDYAAVADYARSQGLTVTEAHAGRTILDVAGPAARVETAFGVRLGRYQLKEGRVAYASAAAPRLPRSIAARLLGIAGLNNLGQMRPNARLRPFAGEGRERPDLPVFGSGNGNGSGPAGGLTPDDIKFAYSLSDVTTLYGTTIVGAGTTTPTTPLDGAGQTLGLFELDGYAPGDIALYVSQFSLPTALSQTGATAPLQNVLLDGATGSVRSASGQAEVTLDIDMALALAPNVTTLYVYEGNETTNPAAAADLFQHMASDTAADGTPRLKVISTSWTLPETQVDPTVLASETASFQQMAAQGQSMFAASGDTGAFAAYDPAAPTVLTQPAVNNPASQPYVTGVGGTTLQYNKPAAATTVGTVTKPATNGVYVAETVWESGTLTSVGGPAASGGGSSELFGKPDYQAGLGASVLRRDVPDVALDADPNTGYDIYLSGKPVTIGGTSAAAPLWAGFTALVNQQRILNGLSTLGFANPPLYAIGKGQSYAADFHDITSGTNLFFMAGAGFDDTTGFGSFIGDALIASLSFNADQGTGTGTISGAVTDANGLGIANATVTAVSTATSAVKATSVTDSAGAYTLTVPTGLALTVTVNPSTVTATDASGNPITYVEQSVSGLTVSTGGALTQNFTLTAAHQFAAGLQMISAPFDFSSVGGDFATLFGLTTPLQSPNPRLIQWQPLLGSYVFYPTAPADTLRPGQGYWINFPVANYLHFAGAAVPTNQSFRIALQPGWNQIGDPFPSSTLLAGLTVDALDGATPAPLASSTATQPTLYSYAPNAGAYAALDINTGSLDPYVGYWIFARQSSALLVPTPPPGIP